MEDIWGESELKSFLAGNKKNKQPISQKDSAPSNLFYDPTHVMTVNPIHWEIDQNKIKNAGVCKECNAHGFDVNSPENNGLCATCKKDPELVKKYEKKCEICGNKPSTTSDNYCNDHEKHCHNCTQEIDDLGKIDQEGNEVSLDEKFCKNHRKYCENCKDSIQDQEEYPDTKKCEGCRTYCNTKGCQDEIDDIGDKDRSYPHGVVPDSETHCEDHRKYCQDCGERITDQDKVDAEEEHCEDHRKFCYDCDGRITDQEEYPESPYCENHRPACLNCGYWIEDDPGTEQEKTFCVDDRKHCKDCYRAIEDQEEYPDAQKCSDCRTSCYGCGEEVEDPGSVYCENCENHCYDCGHVIEDQEEWPDARHCEKHRKNCKTCKDVITSDLHYPESNYCEDDRKICPEKYCRHEVDNEKEDSKTIAELQGKYDMNGEPVTDYCPNHRHRCEMCNKNIVDYDQVKNIVDYYQAKNNTNKWYDMCSDCRDYVKSWEPKNG